LLARATYDPTSYVTRQLAIRALGNLQQFSAEVAAAFFDACQDVAVVYCEACTAVTNFEVFYPDSRDRLLQEVRSKSVTGAWHAALLLRRLGRRSKALGREDRRRVADELHCLLQELSDEDIVYDFQDDSNGKRIGPLYDVVYEALLQVVSGEPLEAPPGTAA